jgi:transglutaminase-like putative cysteine protease
VTAAVPASGPDAQARPSASAAAAAAAAATGPTGRAIADTAVILVLSIIAMAGFGSAFTSYTYLIAGAGGLIVVAAAVLLCQRLGLNVLLTAALAVVAWYIFGPAIALPAEALFGVIPTLSSFASLSIGAVDGWSDLITLHAPVSLPEYINAVPYAAGGLVALATALLAGRWLPSGRRTPLRAAVLLIGPVALYISSVLLGTDEPYFAGIRGIGFAALALVWLGWRRRDGASLALGNGSALFRRKVLGTGVIVVVAVVTGVLVGGAIAPTAASRYVLRDHVQPPFQPLTYPAPLAGFRDYTKALNKSTLFSVTGMKAGQVLRLATLDSYNGEIWGVAGAQQPTDSSGDFRLVVKSHAITSTVTITVDNYTDYWIPDTGFPTSLAFTSHQATSSLENVRYNDVTGTAVLTTGVKKGVKYRVTDLVPAAVKDASLTRVPVAETATTLVSDTPDTVVAKADAITSKSKTPIAKLRALQQYLFTKGYFSHGTVADQTPSRAGHGADRMNEMVTAPHMVGDQEQYASLFALMARSLNYPVRVVMGFDPKLTTNPTGAVKITGNDVTAWDEVDFQGVGWVPFYPTPKNPDVPQTQVPKPQSEPQPQVRQPPRTNSSPDDLVTPVKISKTKPHKKNLFDLPGWVISTAIGILVPLIIIFVPLLIVLGIKRRRLKRRRFAKRGDLSAAGAWAELLDQFSELGYTIPHKTTRIHVASGLDAQAVDDRFSLGALAVKTDTAVFSGDDIDPAESAELWDTVLAQVDSARSGLGRVRRIVSRYRLSTVRAWFARMSSAASAQSEALLRQRLSRENKPPGDKQ